MSSTKIPVPFPKGDKTWIDVFRLEKKGCDWYPYKNDKGEILFIVYVDRTLKGKGAPKSLTFTDFDFDESFTAEPGNYLYILLHRNRNYCQRMFTFKNMSFNVTGTNPDKIEIANNGFEEWKLLNRPDRLVTGTKLGKQKIPKKLASRGTIKLRKFKF